jgi:O-acetyl-ADP-ribose deacetylase
MTRATFGRLTLELEIGDITQQPDMDAVVNAANAQLETGGGVAGALHRAAGPELATEARQYAPINPGEAVTTRAYELPNDYVIHCLGPVYGRDQPSDELLASCYSQSLRIAEDLKLTAIAFPAISTGAFSYPMGEAATVAFSTIRDEAAILEHLRLVRFVLFDQSALDVHAQALSHLIQD